MPSVVLAKEFAKIISPITYFLMEFIALSVQRYQNPLLN